MTPILQAAALLRDSHRPVFFTGAGVSQESGIPTFRDAQVGLWARYAPEDLATPEAFERQPKLVHGFYEYRRKLIRQCVPNAAHRAIAALEKTKPEVRVVTQNVDGFHRTAGSTHVIEVHGDIFLDRCNDECAGLHPHDEPTEEPGICPRCGDRTMRPAVIWFGEMLDQTVWSAAVQAVEACDLMVMIGTSGLVYPAAGLPREVLRAGKPLIEINPEETPMSSSVTLHLRGRAAEVLPEVVELALQR